MEEAERRWTSSLPRGLHGEIAEQRGVCGGGNEAKETAGTDSQDSSRTRL